MPSTNSFWTSVLKDINPPPATKARFIADFDSYVGSLPEEAEDRQSGRLRSIEAHFHLRRRTGGLLPSFDFIYMPFELPDVIAEHPHIKRMTLATGDLVIIANVESASKPNTSLFINLIEKGHLLLERRTIWRSNACRTQYRRCRYASKKTRRARRFRLCGRDVQEHLQGSFERFKEYAIL